MQMTPPLPHNENLTSFSHADVMCCCKQCNWWIVEAARCSVLPDWKWRSIVPKPQNDRIWRIIIIHLATLGRRSTNDSSLYSQSSRKKVERKGDTLSKTCKGVITSL